MSTAALIIISITYMETAKYFNDDDNNNKMAWFEMNCYSVIKINKINAFAATCDGPERWLSYQMK